MDRGEHPYESVRRELRGTAFAAIRYERINESTNDDAAPLLGDPAHAGLTIVADEQTKGAGRRGRSWIASPPNNSPSAIFSSRTRTMIMSRPCRNFARYSLRRGYIPGPKVRPWTSGIKSRKSSISAACE